MDSADLIQQFADSEYLFLVGLDEPRENSLRLLVQDARPAIGPAESRWIAGTEISGLRVIKPDAQSRSFELLWTDYVAYSVRNESYAASDPSAACMGKTVQVCTASAYLHFIRTFTFASSSYPGPLIHVCMHCQMHVIDVVATALPIVVLS